VWRNRAIAAVIVLSVALIAAIGVITWKSELVHRPATTGIAVLPFENLSNDREDASLADGVQDDLVTKLANIADLKVISRISVMQYRGEHNARQIGDALRVSHLLEGSVRKTGAWLHINAQLIDTRTDSHVWAKQYDGDLKELFAIQSKIARTVAEQLHAKISPAEKRAIERRPTADLTAFDLYSRAKNLVALANSSPSGEANLRQAADLLNQAVAHDPTFFQAYCLLAHTHDLLYFFGVDRTPARLALAEAAIQAAFHLRQDAGEAHLARAANLYRGYLDYDGALAELGIAGKSLPNDPQVFELKAYIKRRQGKQQEAVGDLERALELDPRNVVTLEQLAISYDLLHRYADERAIFDRMLVIDPDDIRKMLARASLELGLQGNVRPLHQVIDRIRAKDPAKVRDVADTLLYCALAERDTAAANSALMSLGQIAYIDDPIQFSHPFMEGLVARMAKDDRRAELAFTAARAEQEQIVASQPDYGPPLCVLGLIDAALGRKEEALREGRRAVELLSPKKDPIHGETMIEYFAVIAAWVGDKDLACDQLAIARGILGGPSYGRLKLLPFWDPLRGDPCFEKILASLAPKSE